MFPLTIALSPAHFLIVGCCTRRYCSSSCFTRGWKDHNRLHQLQVKASAFDQQQQQQQQEEEEEEEQEPQPPPQQEHEQGQEHVPLKSEMKGVNGDDDDDDDDDDDAEEALIAGVGIASLTAASCGVRIVGTTGSHAGAINGMYKPTTESSGGMPAYVKVGNGDLWLVYASKGWNVQTTFQKGTDDCLAYCPDIVKCLPEECPAGHWQIGVNAKMVSLPAIVITVVTLEEVEAYRAQVEEESARVVKGSQIVTITGATGRCSSIVNGVYKPTDELCGNATVYVKVDDDDTWLVYRSSLEHWQVKSTDYKGTEDCWAFCSVPAKCLPEDCPTGQWEVADSTECGPQPSITISVVTPEEADAYLAEVQKEASRLVKGSNNVTIAGATGKYADDINGIYKPTEELRANTTVYVKVDDGNICLEYCALFMSWRVKDTAHKGKRAFCVVPAKKCLPEECPAGQWQVFDGTKWGTQQTVAISVQHGNNDAVSADDDDDDEAKPKAAAMKVESGSVVTQTAGVGVGITSHLTSGGVRIVGAMGPNAGRINGVYVATTEMSGDMPVYAKVGYSNMWLEYRAHKTWQVKTTADKGTDASMVFCAVPAKCQPQYCPAGQWKIAVNDTFVTLPAIVVSVVTREEVDAYRAHVEEEAARVVKGSYKVTIAGTTGKYPGSINGIYKPTEELCDNATVYVKDGDGNVWLEYNASKKQWQVKSTGDKSTGLSWAHCAVPVKCLPENCPRGKWLVDNGAKCGPQQTVTISVQHNNIGAASADDVDDDEAKPKAAVLKVDTNLAAAQIAGVDIVSSVASGGVRISGVTGPNTGRINGMYEATTELSGDMPVYAKVGDGVETRELV